MIFRNNRKDVERRNEIELKLRRYAEIPIDELFLELMTSSEGLKSEEIAARQEEYGPNVIVVGTKNTTLTRLINSSINPFNLVLLVIAAITFFTDVIASPVPDWTTISIILSLIIVSSGVAFIQNQRSNAAAEKLSKMISNTANVFRDDDFHEIPIEEIVPGDIVRLAAGDMLPADLRFLSSKDAFIAQASLTGESNPVEKTADIEDADVADIASLSLTDLPNLGFMGTNVISGVAVGVALATNNHTYIGSMAETLSGDRAKNSFERGVDAVSSLLLRFMIVMVPVVMVINGVNKGDWGQAFLFAVSIAVGLTPEMLPVIMTSTLAKGAVTMSRRSVIIKALGAIQAFGEMDVLCTDKTGTLTEDMIVLERYMNLFGEDDRRILRHSYLNSYFQTGLKNLIDLAIINRAQDEGLGTLPALYHRVDEIPFDFTRRRMSVVLEDESGKRQLITKGAVEEIMEICSFADMDGVVKPLSESAREQAMEIYNRHNSAGLRMLAVAQKNEVPGAEYFSIEDECDMVLLGFVGFLDPPKPSAAAAITALADHGVRTIVLTGDSEGVAVNVCASVGIDTTVRLTGVDVENMDDEALQDAVRQCQLFSKLSPAQKERVVKTLQDIGHTVGYLGDGINDAPPLHQADVGISVDNAVDIAKETADIILLKKDLMVLEEGVLEGRRTFGNIVRYIKMAASGNFGNMFSVIVASVFLPFLPMLPVQILTQNLICDLSQMGMPFDRVDDDYLLQPRRWDTRSISVFMALMGPLSSIFDILTFLVLWFVIGANSIEQAPVFQAGWFVFGTLSQVAVIHMIRTAKVPFMQSNAALPLLASTALASLLVLFIGFSTFAIGLDMAVLPLSFVPWLIVVLIAYCLSTQLLKVYYIKRFGEWF
ncbi:MAG: magnesium-translocating P-type ATPase [Coriobacteriia bacterium]|nr:magnesium-translocating P-type ATPase [Coriobacteriia bacterium]